MLSWDTFHTHSTSILIILIVLSIFFHYLKIQEWQLFNKHIRNQKLIKWANSVLPDETLAQQQARYRYAFNYTPTQQECSFFKSKEINENILTIQRYLKVQYLLVIDDTNTIKLKSKPGYILSHYYFIFIGLLVILLAGTVLVNMIFFNPSPNLFFAHLSNKNLQHLFTNQPSKITLNLIYFTILLLSSFTFAIGLTLILNNTASRVKRLWIILPLYLKAPLPTTNPFLLLIRKLTKKQKTNPQVSE